MESAGELHWVDEARSSWSRTSMATHAHPFECRAKPEVRYKGIARYLPEDRLTCVSPPLVQGKRGAIGPLGGGYSAVWDATSEKTECDGSTDAIEKNPCAHKNKIGTPPPKTQEYPPPPNTRNFMGMGFSSRKNAFSRRP